MHPGAGRLGEYARNDGDPEVTGQASHGRGPGPVEGLGDLGGARRKEHMVASGNTTTSAPPRAARLAASVTNARFSRGSMVERSCARAKRMSPL